MAETYSETTVQPGDGKRKLMAKALSALGGTPQPGEGKRLLRRKIIRKLRGDD